MFFPDWLASKVWILIERVGCLASESWYLLVMVEITCGIVVRSSGQMRLHSILRVPGRWN